MSVLNVIGYRDDAADVGGRPPADLRPVPSAGDQFDANLELAQDRSGFNRKKAEGDAYVAIIDALPDDARARLDASVPWIRLGTDAEREAARDAVWREMREARRVNPSLFRDLPATRGEYTRQVRSRVATDRVRNEGVAARSRGFWKGAAGFAGGTAGAMSDPVNVALLPVGGPAGFGLKQILINGVVGAAGEVATLPMAKKELALLGDSETTQEQLTNVAMAGAFGAGFPVAVKIGGKVIELGARAVEGRLPVEQRLARALGKERLDQLSEAELLELYAQAVPAQYRTPMEADALAVLTRRNEVEAASPYVGTLDAMDAHLARVDAEMRKLGVRVSSGRPAADPRPRGSAQAGAAIDRTRLKQAIRGPESAGDDRATNRLGSSASGRYQFVEGTFETLYNQVYGKGGAAAWTSDRRFDVAVQEALMDRLIDENSAALRRAGVPVTDGNLYVMHVLGGGDGPALLRADPDVDVAAVLKANNPKLGETIVRQNPTYFGGGRSVGDALAVIRGKVGDGNAAPTTSISDPTSDFAEPALARNPDLDAVRPLVSTEGRRLDTVSLRPDDIDVDAGLMQFKSGGDAFGVTDRLQGIKRWDPIASGVVTVWEGNDGRRLIADGHQRLALAKRMMADDPAADIRLNAYVLREADGFSALDARIITALKNIGEGSGTALDAAKVFREGGDAAAQALATSLPPRSALVRDGKTLARLSGEAFDAVNADVIPENYGAVIGALAPDPDTHMALVELLAKSSPANARQAEGVVRQALDAGFTRETQDELFGAREFSTALFAQKARAVDRTLAELKKLKGLFSTAARNAGTLEGAGNRIDAVASAAEAKGNADVLAIVEALAYSKGHVSDIFNAAAGRIASGEPLARVVADVVADLRQLDLAALGRESGDFARYGDAADGGGRGRIADDEAEFDGEARDAGGLTAAERAALDHDEPGLALFDDPGSPASGGALDAAVIRHDLKAATEPTNQSVEASPVQAMPVAADFLSGQTGKTLDELVTMAQANQVELGRLAAEIAPNARIVDGGAKKPERIMRKVADEGYDEPGDLKDLARLAIVVENVADAETIARKFAARMPTMDKSWYLTLGGYLDRKLIIRFDNGGLAEVQLVPAAIADYKFGDARPLYDQARRAATPDVDRELALATMRERYAALLVGTDFEGISGKAAIADGSSSSLPSTSALARSAGDAGTQAPFFSSEAVSPSTTISRSSSSTNSIDEPSEAIDSTDPVRNQHDGTRFALRDGGDETAADALLSIDTEEAALKALRDCL